MEVSSTNNRTDSNSKNILSSISLNDPLGRQFRDDRVVGLSQGLPGPPQISAAEHQDSFGASLKVTYDLYNRDVRLENDEMYARMKEEKRPFVLFLLGHYTAFKIFLYYLTSLSSLFTVALTVGLTMYWYNEYQTTDIHPSSLDWVILGFAVVTPLSTLIGLAFRRRDRALIEIAKFRSFAFQVFLAHCLWDWATDTGNKGRSGTSINWIGHVDDVLTELIAMGDELCRFLTMPTTSRSRHRVTKSGRREAARTAEVAYKLYDSLYTKRMIRLTVLGENFKRYGLGASEASRIRQYERWMGDAIENLRMIKNYRTPQTLRSFARLFTTLLPPFFAPTYAQIAVNLNSLAMGMSFGVIVALCLNALLDGIETLEDPFVGFVTLDGIDIREEFRVLHWHQLVSARNEIFSLEPPYVGPRRDAFFVSQDSHRHDQAMPSSRKEDEAGIPLGSISESTKSSHKRRHVKNMLSLGDGSLLAGLQDLDNRKSGYQLFSKHNEDNV